jgi:hypothetical protein
MNEETQLAPADSIAGEHIVAKLQEEKPQYIILELEDGGESVMLVKNFRIRSLIYTPAVAADDTRLSNPYPGESRPERWSVQFDYDNRYNITEACYNKLKESLTPLVVELSSLGN